MPQVFKLHYLNAWVVIHSTEIKTELPNRVDNKVCPYSSHKGAHTFKLFVLVTSNRFITFKSPCYGDRASNFETIPSVDME